MSELAIRRAFEQRLNSLTSDPVKTQFENVPYVPVQGVPYQRGVLEAADPENPSIGALLHRALGLYRISLHYPVNEGSQAAWARAEALRAGFPRGLSMLSGGVRVLITRTPRIASTDGPAERYSLIVRIPYQADIFTT